MEASDPFAPFDRADVLALLDAISKAEDEGRGLEGRLLKQLLEKSEVAVDDLLREVERWGLAVTGLTEDTAGINPYVRDAGAQTLAADGAINAGALRFLPIYIDDLVAREALLVGGSIMVDEFTHAIAIHAALEHARTVVPPAFVEAVTEEIAVRLYAAAVAVTTRLQEQIPAASVAEEIMAVEMMDQAAAWLELQVDSGDLTPEAAKSAREEFSGIFELFQDDDVLNLFEMDEPADAAVAGHSFINAQMGVADQRIEAWFKPLWGYAATGYLEPRDD